MSKDFSRAQRHGVLVLNKPKGPTSAGCLEKIKRRLGQKKIGHAGTLDPMAQGVLIVLLGQGTKLAPYLGGGEKTYSGQFILGFETDTFDIEGATLAEYPWDDVTEEQVRKGILAWRRLKEQEVPPYSAAKHKGQPLYALKRAGKEVPVKTKPVSIPHAEVLDIDLPRVRFRVHCSQGTYIRSLAHSLGKRLGCGAVLSELVRERSHPFTIDQAHDLDSLLDQPETFPGKILSPEEALSDWPSVRLDREAAARIRNGMRLNPADAGDSLQAVEGQQALFLDHDGAALALMEIRASGDRLQWHVMRGLWPMK